MNIQDIYELLERFDHSSVAELKLEMEGAKISFKKSFSTSTGCEEQKRSAEVQEESQPMSFQPIKTSAMEVKSTEAQQLNLKSLTAPLAGTFYHAPSPEAEPFVKKGQRIHKGDVIGIIEAMKLMNEVTALEDGVVEELVAEDGTLVAYDEVLMTYV